MAKKVYARLEDLPRAEMPTDHRFKDLTGKVYGRLTVLWFAERRGKKKTWACECACGGYVVVRSSHLTSEATGSCGCYHRQRTVESSITHGMSRTSIYHVWSKILARCTNAASQGYHRYGGRGILAQFESFTEFYTYIATELGERPSPKHSLDRINNDGNYERGNLRWATQSEQCRNTGSNRLVTWEGHEMALIAACELAGINYKTVFNRISQYGWPPEKALSTPIRPIKRKPPC